MVSALPQLTTWYGTNAATLPRQSWALPTSSPPASALPPVISKAGGPAPSPCSESSDSPLRLEDQPGTTEPAIAAANRGRQTVRCPTRGREHFRRTRCPLSAGIGPVAPAVVCEPFPVLSLPWRPRDRAPRAHA